MKVFTATFLVSLLLAATLANAEHNILDYGAVSNASGFDLTSSKKNGKAFYDAVQAAHNAAPGGDRTVVIPATAGDHDGHGGFAWMPHKVIDGIYNVTIRLDGVLNFYEGNITDWPGCPTHNCLNGIDIQRSSLVTLTGSGHGAIHGNGLRWWWENILWQVGRPNMFQMSSCIGTIMEHWHFFNSPQYHVALWDTKDMRIQHCTIQVDINDQRRLLQAAGHWSSPDPEGTSEAGLLSRGAHKEIQRLAKKDKPHGGDAGFPTFPLNTDGFDISGTNITLRHCHVENFDDAYCMKPNSRGSNLSHCTTDLHFEDSSISFGVGASVGSVGPSTDVNCIANSSFKRISFKTPIKAIYVKPNPCPNGASVDGTGIIDNILYEDIYAEMPLWWSIWVSTQQQHQPGAGADTGCSFFFPIPGHKCPTQPCVPVTNLKLKNVFMKDALLSPGIMRCNESNPCTGWEWNNVTVKSLQDWPVNSNNFLCHAVHGANFTDVTPACTDHISGYGTKAPQAGAEGAADKKMLMMAQEDSMLHTPGRNNRNN